MRLHASVAGWASKQPHPNNSIRRGVGGKSPGRWRAEDYAARRDLRGSANGAAPSDGGTVTTEHKILRRVPDDGWKGFLNLVADTWSTFTSCVGDTVDSGTKYVYRVTIQREWEERARRPFPLESRLHGRRCGPQTPGVRNHQGEERQVIVPG